MVLNGTQREWVINALLDAFPRYADFKYLIAIQLGENIETIAPLVSNLRDCVFELVAQMEARGKLEDLLLGALRQNPKNPQLLQCVTKLGLSKASDADEVFFQPTNTRDISRRNRKSSDIPPLPLSLRTELIAALLRLPGIQRFEGRSSLLHALPSKDTLDRNSSNTKQDLVGIVDQLSHLGQTSSRQWPLILLLDTAVEDIRGYTLEEDIKQLRQQLVEHYGEA
jgi:hypothetical protein